MNVKVSPAVSDRRGRRRILAVATGWYLMAAMVASCALCASAQIDSIEFMRGSPPESQQFVSTNQLLTPKKAQKATEHAREALLRGRYQEAQKQVTRALEICPNCAIALTLQGIMKMDENYAEAAHTFQQAINADPTLGAAYIGLGHTYNMLGRFKEALVPLARGDEILPAAWVAHFDTAVAHLGIGESEAALQEITRAEQNGVDRQSRSALLYLRAKARLQLNDYSQARAALEEVIKQDPKGEYGMLAQQALEQLSARLTNRR
jgi:tetratricopeptide (TPR) repeat protein